MPIPESQLDTWARQGSVKQSRDTYATVRTVLEASTSPYAQRSYASFLQGSYGNDTNIYADSDVDVVVRLDSIYYHDIDQLPADQLSVYLSTTGDATYSFDQFKRDVISHLTAEYGSDVQPGKKTIFIKGRGNRRNADVLVCAQLRRYTRYISASDQSYAEGVSFFLPDGTRVDNFPKQHAENCTAKHKATAQWFKPMVRVLKNARNRMIDDGLIADGLAPSYYLEGLLYNVPDDKFGGSYNDTFADAINWILEADRSEFVCANELYYLLREESPVTWRDASCTKFLNALVQFWNEW